MEYKSKDTNYESVSPGTMGVAQKISSSYATESVESVKSDEENSGLVFLAKNDVIACGHNQY